MCGVSSDGDTNLKTGKGHDDGVTPSASKAAFKRRSIEVWYFLDRDENYARGLSWPC